MIPGELIVDTGELTLNPGRRTITLVVENGADRPIQVEAIAFAKKIAKNVMGVHVELSPENKEEVVRAWEGLWPDIPLHILSSPYRSVTEPLIKFLEETDKKYNGEPTALVLPTFVPAEWWQTILHTQTTWRIRQAILNSSKETGVERTIIEVPYLLKK